MKKHIILILLFCLSINYSQAQVKSNTQVKPSSEEKSYQTIEPSYFNLCLDKLNKTTLKNLEFNYPIAEYPNNPPESEYKTQYYQGEISFQGYIKEVVISETPQRKEIKSIKHGRGTVFFTYPTEYTKGYFVNDRKEGYGEEVFSDFVYKGYFINNKKNGEGIYLSDNKKGYLKTLYEGEFENNKFQGKGILICRKFVKKGLFYDGDLVDGEILYSDGATYRGKLKDGKKHGKGILTYSSGDKYDGEFKNNKYNGTGSYIYKNGQKKSGLWSNGILTKTQEEILQEKREIEEYQRKESERLALLTSGNFDKELEESFNTLFQEYLKQELIGEEPNLTKLIKNQIKKIESKVLRHTMSSDELQYFANFYEKKGEMMSLGLSLSKYTRNDSYSSTKNIKPNKNVYICSSDKPEKCCRTVVVTSSSPKTSGCCPRTDGNGCSSGHSWNSVGKTGEKTFQCSFCAITVNTDFSPRGGGCCPINGCIGHSWKEIN
ncbi:hypothetical protein [Gaetbulibacter jejuensis]|uniref:MORN repeat-containing protein n=1 Tax=Gaetbulibacter jejuensis TaxID=584607 RepID=UPI0030094208